MTSLAEYLLGGGATKGESEFSHSQILMNIHIEYVLTWTVRCSSC